MSLYNPIQNIHDTNPIKNFTTAQLRQDIKICMTYREVLLPEEYSFMIRKVL